LLLGNILARKKGMLVKWHIGLSYDLSESGAEPPSSLGKALKDLKQSRDTGTRALAHHGVHPFRE
jgi:hypothetical protein